MYPRKINGPWGDAITRIRIPNQAVHFNDIIVFLGVMILVFRTSDDLGL